MVFEMTNDKVKIDMTIYSGEKVEKSKNQKGQVIPGLKFYLL